MKKLHSSFVLLLTCKDNTGLVKKISEFIFELNGNINLLNEHVDQEENIFSIRIAFDLLSGKLSAYEIGKKFTPLAEEFNADFKIQNSENKFRTAIFVSKSDHCIREILWRYSIGEYLMDIPLIISNHPNLSELAELYKIPFYYVEMNPKNKDLAEKEQLKLLKKYEIDTIILARYMQILSNDFVDHYPNQIINIHHSFLPAFIGGNPYKQAFDRGVKLIGATSHYVTNDLDEGPIIEQDITRITHKDTVKDLKRKGRDLERLVLAKAVQLHTENRVIVRGKKTIVFE